MSIKRILAAAAASVVAVSATSVIASAKLANPNSGENYLFDLMAEGYTVTDVYGVTFTISGDFAETGVGGGIGFNSASTGWDQHEWGNADAAKEITITEDNKITLLGTAPAFAESDTTGDNPYAQIFLQQWWGNDATVEKVEILGKDGAVLTASATPESKPEESKPEESKPEESKTETKPNVDTGVEGVAAVVGVAVVAAGALVVAKKRK